MMTMGDFERVLARHGADEAAWPPADRAMAAVLLRTSAAARALLADARALDRLLLEVPALEAPATLKAGILARLNAQIAGRAELPAAPAPFWRRFWPQAAGFAAASLLGFVLGLANGGTSGDPPPDVSAYVLGFDGDAVTLSMNGGPAADEGQAMRKGQQ